MPKQIVVPNTAPQTVVPGQKSVLKIAKGQHLRVQEVVAQQAVDAGNVIATKHGQDLHLKFADGTEIQLEGFYDECGGKACSVTVAGKEAGGYTIDGNTAVGSATSDGGNLVYAYGDHDSLMAMANGDSGMSAALGGLGEGMVAYVPADTGLGAWGLGALGAGGGLALAGGGGGGGAASSAAATSVATSVVSGSVVAGPVVAGHGLTVEIYAADGTTKLGEATVDANGQFSVNVGTYTGVVIARLVDANAGADYMDESTGTAKDLNATLMATAVVAGGNVTVNINPLTTVAAIKAGMNSDGSVGTALTSTGVDNANSAVADAFGLTNLLGETVVTTVDTSGGANTAYNTGDGLSNAEKYGAALAALSGADANNSGDSQATIDDIVAGLTVSGSSGTLDSTATDTVVAGAQTTDPSNTLGLVNTVSDATTTTSSSITIGAVATDNIINASETGSIITGTAAANASITLTLGSGNTQTVTADGSGDWSYTLQAGDLTAMGQGAETLSVTDGSNTSTRGIFIDTLAPTLAISSNVSAVKGGETATITFTFSEAPTGFTASDISITGGTLSGFAVTADPKVYTATFTPTADLASGSASITVAAGTYTDAAGNPGGAGSTPAISIDTLAPTITAVTADWGTSLNATEDDSDGTVTVTTSGVEDGRTVTLTLNNVNYTGTVSSNSASITVTAAALQALTDGQSYTLTANVSDAAGNAATAHSGTSFTVDTTTPTISAVSIPEVAMKVGDVVTATITVSNASGETLTLGNGSTIGGFTLGSLTKVSDTSYTATFTVTEGGTDVAAGSSIPVSVQLSDPAGNASNSYTTAISQAADAIDANKPTTTAVTAGWGTHLNATEDDSDGTVTVTTSGVENGQTVTLTLNGTNYTGTVSSNSASITVAAADLQALTNGQSYTLTANVSDAAGNAATAHTGTSFTVDTSAPNAPAITSVTDDQSTVTLADGAYTNDTTPTVRVSLTGTNALADDTVQLYDGLATLGAAVTLTSTDIGNGYVDITTPTLANGSSHDFRASVIDAAGNASSLSATGAFDISIDTTAPTATITGVAYDAASNTLTLSGTNFDTLVADGAASGEDIKGQLDWNQLTWDINGDDGTTPNVTFTASDIASAVATDDGTLTITLNTDKATALEGTGAYDAFTTNDTLAITAGFTGDAAGNVSAGDAYSGPSYAPPVDPDPSIVVFDLVNGQSSSHSNRTFDANTPYTIYILIDSDNFALTSAPIWSGAEKLGIDDLIVLVGDTGWIDVHPAHSPPAITPDGYSVIISSRPWSFTMSAFGYAGTSSHGSGSRAVGYFEHLVVRYQGIVYRTVKKSTWTPGNSRQSRRTVTAVITKDIWSGSWKAMSGPAGANHYLQGMPAGVMTTQGLV